MVEHMLTTLFFSLRCFSFYLSAISQTSSSLVSSSISFHIFPCFCMTSLLSCHSHLDLPFGIVHLFLHSNLPWDTIFLFFLNTCPYHCILFLVNLCSNAFILKFALILLSHLSLLCLFLLYFCWS
jgi:hypothetical protein